MGVKALLRWRPAQGSSADQEEVLQGIVEQLLGCKPVGSSRGAGAGAGSSRMEVKCYLLRQQNPSGAVTAVAGNEQPQQGAAAGGAAPGGMRDVWLVQIGDVPEACFLLDRGHYRVIEADNGMLQVIERKLSYGIKTSVTLAGRRYVKGECMARQ
jgi:hypothetical protein